jgi:hypothetical protein
VILFGLRDTGSVNACLPVITILKNQEIPVSVYAEGPAFTLLRDRFTLISECKMDDLLDSVRPSLVVVTVATKGGSIPIDLNNEAKQRNLPTVLIEEMWAGHSASEWKILPDGACVTDKFAKSLVLQSWPDYPESNIHITGASIFDKFINVQTEVAKHRLRQALHVYENWPVVFFPGTGQIWGMIQAVSMLVEALNKLSTPIYLILRDHPAISCARSTEYREALKDLRMGMVVDSSKLTSDEVNAGSDIVVGTFSSMTVEACYLRKSVLTIWTPEIRQSFLKATNNILAEWPITNLGASLKAESAGEVKSCLQKILAGDTTAMMEAQQKHFKSDGLNGERVAKAILNYYRC